jgi:hypothetical protein
MYILHYTWFRLLYIHNKTVIIRMCTFSCHLICIMLHRATSTVNRITYLPWSDSDLAELRKVTPLPQEFEDPNGLPQLSTKQRSSILNWMRPYDICDNPRMVHLISSFSIKQVLLNECRFCLLSHACHL